MTGACLAETQTEIRAAFSDAHSAERWLTSQPLANTSAMLAELLPQLRFFNQIPVSPRERLKTLEVLRKIVFTVCLDAQRRFEFKALPLLPAEQSAFDSAYGIWQACRVGYLTCLQACLKQDDALAKYRAKVTQRVLACLRMEQLAAYVAGTLPAPGFWRDLHAVFAAAERLGIAREPVDDRLWGEGRAATACGHYSMALMLHQAGPDSFSRVQFSAVIRWLSRWRERAEVLLAPSEGAVCLPLDLAQDSPFSNDRSAAERWLGLDGVRRKIRQRLDALAKGESPEALKLGSALPADACVSLLSRLLVNLASPSAALTADVAAFVPMDVVPGVEAIFRLLGGKGLRKAVDDPLQQYGGYLQRQQLAVFGHVPGDESRFDERVVESWRVAAKNGGQFSLMRLAEAAAPSRFRLGSLLALRVGPPGGWLLARIDRLRMRQEGGLCVSASALAGEPSPLIVEIRERPVGRLSRHPALLLPNQPGGSSATVILPEGVSARALPQSIRIVDALNESTLALQLGALLERSGDNERWSLVREVSPASRD
ncbi:hypothetical protein [Propionivibrio limicola]|uniref:hypothetical protein n=1 Tax=Propionivibrio limicola TaxID=167645 RepID=UPI001290E4A1|nr:hypothetical protein [Propionivibrio limicola]